MKPFVILGATKTGTSTSVAVANTHPSVFCLFECDFTRPFDSGRNADLTQFLPTTKRLFMSDMPFSDGLRQIDEALDSHGLSFEWIGTKVPKIRPDLLHKVEDIPVLFMMRDVRTWAVKNRVITDVLRAKQDTNIVPPLVSFASYYLSAFLIENCIRLPLEKTFEPTAIVFPDAFSRLLNEPRELFEKWWIRASSWKKTPPKNYSSWVDGHYSAFLPPFVNDTKSSLKRHPFWDEFLPVFDKYFLAAEKQFPKEEILNDKKILARIETCHTMTIDEGFEQFDSFKLNGVTIVDNSKVEINISERIEKTAGENWKKVD